jgi:hypothetical protein
MNFKKTGHTRFVSEMGAIGRNGDGTWVPFHVILLGSLSNEDSVGIVALMCKDEREEIAENSRVDSGNRLRREDANISVTAESARIFESISMSDDESDQNDRFENDSQLFAQEFSVSPHFNFKRIHLWKRSDDSPLFERFQIYGISQMTRTSITAYIRYRETP